jgi:hypothetical protein
MLAAGNTEAAPVDLSKPEDELADQAEETAADFDNERAENNTAFCVRLHDDHVKSLVSVVVRKVNGFGLLPRIINDGSTLLLTGIDEISTETMKEIVSSLEMDADRANHYFGAQIQRSMEIHLNHRVQSKPTVAKPAGDVWVLKYPYVPTDSAEIELR